MTISEYTATLANMDNDGLQRRLDHHRVALAYEEAADRGYRADRARYEQDCITSILVIQTNRGTI